MKRKKLSKKNEKKEFEEQNLEKYSNQEENEEIDEEEKILAKETSKITSFFESSIQNGSENESDETSILGDIIIKLREDLLKNGKIFTAFEFNEQRAVYEYFMKANEDAANIVYISPKKYTSKRIRFLGKFYLLNKSFPVSYHGKHSKCKRLIDAEDIALKSKRWLTILGCKFEEYKKGMYLDGHEREDVVKY
ncbi:hypothetical protein Glove_420g89 [Diversispora epigaea]|uniref:Uncharacterized protein n=1 Tax=Diversispora epigaea TaxID=1348612 RepID=A0A397H0A5_9GLOM|nr:hypothetical protein Glove_420g89 [Diversispora epigaea]